MSEYKYINDITVGMKVSNSHLITDEKIRAFATISEDYNPIHLDEEYAKNSKFGRRIAHGAMITSFFSALFATNLPGPGSIYVSQTTQFKKPVFINDTVFVEIEVMDIDVDRKRVYFLTSCYVNEICVLNGKAEIYISRVNN
ncbi:Acyl dehydratase [Psychrobacter okhotskensis]|uniref:MaoC family dehydratase n=1 Tax=Psychrobacter okhotskensis TaxID=212403 RepID=UPI003F54E8CC